MPVRVRDSRDADLPAIAAIYAHAVRFGTASFEYEPPGPDELGRRREAILAGGFPYLAAEIDGALAGYAYASTYRPRPAYRFCAEDSIYVAPDRQGQGIGRALLPPLIARCEAIGLRLMIAVIGDLANTASIRLHAACGFSQAGLLPAIGWKHGRWLDSVLMTRPLGPGAATPPEPL
ncbi:MAG TPA: GNAT family N-acetyltransferase [Acetobacteraceae bacterium]|jgi:phosphinothricin acetyltransferase|nr:GNAT family N-acetyltransferase [Acetobacteraceae bacterium]